MRTDFVRKHAAHAAKIRRSKRQSKKNFVVYYKIERDFIDLTPEVRTIERNASKEHEIWKEIWTAIDEISASKGRLLGKAVTYALNQKPFMENYFLDGTIPISNNFTESCGARPYAVGRKNFYFHDTPDGAEASAIIYSLAQTAKLLRRQGRQRTVPCLLWNTLLKLYGKTSIV